MHQFLEHCWLPGSGPLTATDGKSSANSWLMAAISSCAGAAFPPPSVRLRSKTGNRWGAENARWTLI